MRKMANSAGLSGATRIKQTSRPLSRSFWLMVERSHCQCGGVHWRTGTSNRTCVIRVTDGIRLILR
jgi:hypothetical protein